MDVNPSVAMGNSLSLKRSKSENTGTGWRRQSGDGKKRGKFHSVQDFKRGGSRKSTPADDQNAKNSTKKSASTTPPSSQTPPKLNRDTSRGSSTRRKTSNGSAVGSNVQKRPESLGDSGNLAARFSDPTGKVLTRMSSLDTKETTDAATTQESLPKRNSQPMGLGSRKKDARLSPAQKDLIKECWDTSKHTEFGTRIYTRYFQKRPDIKRVFDAIEISKPGYSWKDESREFNVFLHTLIEIMDDPETMEDMSRDWGSKYVVLRDYGFKPQFWVPFSEIMTTECLYLDGGVHPVADMIEAWATFITIMLGHMRDGFYSQLRHLRKMSRRRQSTWTNIGLLPQESSDKESSVIGDSLGQSVQSLDNPVDIYAVATNAAFHDIYEHDDLSPASESPKKTVGFHIDVSQIDETVIHSDGYSSAYETPPSLIVASPKS